MSAFMKESAKKQEDQCRRYTRAVQRPKRNLSGPSINICKKNLKVRSTTGIKTE